MWMSAWQRLAPYAETLYQLLKPKQLVGDLANVGVKEVEGNMGAHDKLAHSFLSEHPARSSLRKKDIRIMQSNDQHYSLELALTLSTLVRHLSDGDCTICPTPLNADPMINNYTVIEREFGMQNVPLSSISGGIVAGLTTLQSTVASGHLRFGSWCLAPKFKPPVIFNFGLRLNVQVGPQRTRSSAADHARPFQSFYLCTVLRTYKAGSYVTSPGL
jgi:hypothetical protein